MPAFTIVLSLLGAFAAMYAFGFSLDNLSLIALVIAIGFVVDDAIVEVENVFRHIEDGAAPLQAAIEGSAEIRFTVLSISASLIAVFIPLLLIGGIVGRLFFEFAVTVMTAVAVSALVSLSLAPMLCARFLGRHAQQHSRLYLAIERGFDAMLAGYRRTLDVVLRHQAITLAVFFATLGLTVILTVEIPKGFFPIQDTGMINGLAEAAQDVSPAEMMQLQRELGRILLRDSAIAGFVSHPGSRRQWQCADGKYGALFHCPQAARRAHADGFADYQSAAAEECPGRGRKPVSPDDPGYHGRRALGAGQLPVYTAGCRHS